MQTLVLSNYWHGPAILIKILANRSLFLYIQVKIFEKNTQSLTEFDRIPKLKEK